MCDKNLSVQITGVRMRYTPHMHVTSILLSCNLKKENACHLFGLRKQFLQCIKPFSNPQSAKLKKQAASWNQKNPGKGVMKSNLNKSRFWTLLALHDNHFYNKYYKITKTESYIHTILSICHIWHTYTVRGRCSFSWYSPMWFGWECTRMWLRSITMTFIWIFCL